MQQIDVEQEPEIYVPRPGSVPWRVLSFLVANPDEQLTRGDVAVKFDCIGGGVDTILQLAVARECLKKTRNSELEVVWILGMVKRFRLDPLDADDKSVAALQKAMDHKPPAAATHHQAIKVVEPLSSTAGKAAPMLNLEAIAREGKQAMEPPSKIPVRANQSHPFYSAVEVSMPVCLTQSLVDAVAKDPRTSFENKADGHHAIGWLHDAYRVMVETTQKAAESQSR